jgi:hypothetical protein
MDEDNPKKSKLTYIESVMYEAAEERQKIIEAVSKAYSPAFKAINDLAQKQKEIMRPVVEQLNTIKPRINDLVRLVPPQVDLLHKWAEENKKTFEVFGNLAISFKRNDFLLDNGWIICPYLTGKNIEKVLRSNGIFKKNNSEINAIYEDFFCGNDYSELEQMINGWRSNKYFKKRINIFTDCLFLLKNFRRNRKNVEINPSRLIMPDLISQIDGITTEFAKDKGLKIDKMEWKDPTGNKAHKFDCIWEEPCYDNADVSTITMLESYLFSKAYPYGQINPTRNKEQPKKVKLRPFFQFSRHKIMHGEDLRFGTIDNVLRTYILLDFLAHLK